MGKNDFDIDFDFEKEYGLDPKEFLDSDGHDDDIDLSEFSDEDLGLTSSGDGVDADIYGQDFMDKEVSDDSYSEEDDLDAFLNMRKERAEETPQEDDYSEEDFSQEDSEYPEAEELHGDAFGPEDYSEDYPEDGEEEEGTHRKQRPRKERKVPKISLPKIPMPNIFGKFVDVYFAPMLNKEMREGPVDPDNPRRRRRKSPAQIFKEVYLPPLIACICLILVMSFAIGSLSEFIQSKKDEADRQQSQLSSSISAAEQEEQRIQQIMDEAEALATGYDYDGAIAKLKTVGSDLTAYPDIAAKSSEYVQAQLQLVQHNDPSLIPNLSFHVLIEDMTRALADDELVGAAPAQHDVLVVEPHAVVDAHVGTECEVVPAQEQFVGGVLRDALQGELYHSSTTLPLMPSRFHSLAVRASACFLCSLAFLMAFSSSSLVCPVFLSIRFLLSQTGCPMQS